ncbi:MAG: 50S ribosomal protein L22 [Bacteroidota bacterium]
MEAKAINRFIGTSPRKMRLVIDLIRGRAVEDALSILHFAPKHAARTAEKVLRSAISNFQNKDESGRVDTATLFVKEVFVNGGPTAKRVLPAPMGRAFRVRKRSNHVTVIIGQRVATTVAPRLSTGKPGTKSKEVKPKEPKTKVAKATEKSTAAVS